MWYDLCRFDGGLPGFNRSSHESSGSSHSIIFTVTRQLPPLHQPFVQATKSYRASSCSRLSCAELEEETLFKGHMSIAYHTPQISWFYALAAQHMPAVGNLGNSLSSKASDPVCHMPAERWKER